MTKEEVIDAINTIKEFNMETQNIEVKSAEKGFPKRCYDTVSSFANKNGGIILFGFSEEENFKTLGVYDVNDLQKQITSLCSDSMEPSVRCEILPIKYESKDILAVKIIPVSQSKKPVFYKSKGMKAGSYIRVGDRDELMTDYEIYEFESYKNHINEELRLDKNSTIDDLDYEELEKYIIRTMLDKPNFENNNFVQNLQVCRIIGEENGKIYPTLAGTMIFGKYPQMNYPQLFLACTIFPGYEIGDLGDTEERFVDNKRVEGTI